MEEDKFTPPGWHWKITPEQIEKIKERDRDTLNQVYFDNLSKFKAIAYTFCAIRRILDYFEDCIQQIYVDLLDYDFSNRRTVFWSIRNSLYRVAPPRAHCTVSLYAPIHGTDDSKVLLDCIPSFDEVDTNQEKEEQERRVLEIIAAQKHLNARAKDILTAYAFDCLCYKGLFAYEYNKVFTAQY